MYPLWYIVYYFSEKLGKIYKGLKGHRFIWKYWLYQRYWDKINDIAKEALQVDDYSVKKEYLTNY